MPKMNSATNKANKQPTEHSIVGTNRMLAAWLLAARVKPFNSSAKNSVRKFLIYILGLSVVGNLLCGCFFALHILKLIKNLLKKVNKK